MAGRSPEQRLAPWTVGAARDMSAEQAASLRYEQLRRLDRGQLAALAGFDAPRQQLIAHIIEQERSMT